METGAACLHLPWQSFKGFLDKLTLFWGYILLFLAEKHGHFRPQGAWKSNKNIVPCFHVLHCSLVNVEGPVFRI